MSDGSHIGEGASPLGPSPLATEAELETPDTLAVPLGPRSEYIANYVGDRIGSWIRTNTHSSPQGTSKPGVPSRQHLETWERMANEEADKMRLSDEIVAANVETTEGKSK
jgi:hypothetical protein